MATGRPKLGSMSPCVVCGVDVWSPPSRKNKCCSMACRDVANKAKRYNEVDGTKKCAKCGEWLPLGSFAPYGGLKAGPHSRQSYCNPCAAVAYIAYTTAGLRKGKKPRGSTPKDRATIATRQRTDLPSDPRERRNLLMREWRKRNREKVLLWNKLRIHRQRAAGVPVDRHDIQWLLCRQDYRCTYCGGSLVDKRHIDHMTPISRGGDNDVANIQMLCPMCNLKKGTRTHDEYLALLPGKNDEMKMLAETIERLMT